MKDRFGGNGDPSLVGPDVIVAVAETERGREQHELAARMPVKEALRLQEDSFRCPECLGRVRLRAASLEKGVSEHAEHYSKNTGCSLGNCFTGEKQMHLKPLN